MVLGVLCIIGSPEALLASVHLMTVWLASTSPLQSWQLEMSLDVANVPWRPNHLSGKPMTKTVYIETFCLFGFPSIPSHFWPKPEGYLNFHRSGKFFLILIKQWETSLLPKLEQWEPMLLFSYRTTWCALVDFFQGAFL